MHPSQLIHSDWFIPGDSGGRLTQNSVDSDGGVLFNEGEHYWK